MEPVSDSVRCVRQAYAEKYEDDEELFDQIMSELGPDKPVEKQLLRVRQEIIGNTLTNRNLFDPNYCLESSIKLLS